MSSANKWPVNVVGWKRAICLEFLEKVVERAQVLLKSLFTVTVEVVFEIHLKWLKKTRRTTLASLKKIKEANGSEIQTELKGWTGQGTVPNVFIAGNHIGGCDSTTGLHNQGKLVPLLTSAGAVVASSS